MMHAVEELARSRHKELLSAAEAQPDRSRRLRSAEAARWKPVRSRQPARVQVGPRRLEWALARRER